MCPSDGQAGDGALSPTLPKTQDRQIAELVTKRLRGNSFLAHRELSCECRHGVLFLQGELPTYYLKQIAQAVAAEVNGVREIVNRIEVRWR